MAAGSGSTAATSWRSTLSIPAARSTDLFKPQADQRRQGQSLARWLHSKSLRRIARAQLPRQHLHAHLRSAAGPTQGNLFSSCTAAELRCELREDEVRRSVEGRTSVEGKECRVAGKLTEHNGDNRDGLKTPFPLFSPVRKGCFAIVRIGATSSSSYWTKVQYTSATVPVYNPMKFKEETAMKYLEKQFIRARTKKGEKIV